METPTRGDARARVFSSRYEAEGAGGGNAFAPVVGGVAPLASAAGARVGSSVGSGMDLGVKSSLGKRYSSWCSWPLLTPRARPRLRYATSLRYFLTNLRGSPASSRALFSPSASRITTASCVS